MCILATQGKEMQIIANAFEVKFCFASEFLHLQICNNSICNMWRRVDDECVWFQDGFYTAETDKNESTQILSVTHLP